MSKTTPPSLDELEAQIKSARELGTTPKEEEEETPSHFSGYSTAMKVATDLVSGVVVGVAIGYFIDDYLGTMPIFLIICMLLGTAGGVKLMMEHTKIN